MSCAKVQDMPLLQQKKPNPSTPTGISSRSVNDHEVLQRSKHDLVECYSDDGYPTLPRPKVILSLRHSDAGTWSRRQASLLQTVPVRIRSSNEQPTEPQRARSFSLDTATEPHRYNKLQFPHHAAAKTDTESKRRSERQKIESTEPKVRVLRSKSLSVPNTRLTNGSLQPVYNSPLLTDCREPSQTPPGHSPTCMQDMSTNHSRVLARRAAADGNMASRGNTKPKKPRKLGRAITFSFGAGSDKKRRSLGFLGKEKNDESGPEYCSPSSPILTGNRKTKLVGSSSVHDFQHKTIDNHKLDSSGDNWGRRSIPVNSHHNEGSLVRNHFGSCRDFHSIDESDEVRYQPRVPLYIPVRSETDSPDCSPTLSGLSSRQESVESLSLSLQSEPVPRFTVSNPPSRSHSPNVWKSNIHDTHLATPPRERKLSDPAPTTPEQERRLGSPSSASPRGSTLRKRNTFCVRDTRETQRPGWHEMRHHVVRFLLETEQSYVQSLQTVIKVYMEPLYRPQAIALIEPSLAKDIFHQIPEVYKLHEKFLGQVMARVEGWTADSKIGDVFVNTFSKCHLLDVYRKFIGNFMRAKSAIEIAKQARPVFAKFLEQRAKDSRGRFTLDDLLIKPVQRIPRYVLFIKDLLKHTTVSHPDHAPLQQALGELTALAERVNASERERGRLEEQKELIAGVDGLAQKGNVQKRDRFLILFSDMVVCACARRKSSGLIRGSLLNLNSAFTDALKHSVKWYTPLTKVSRAQLQGPTYNKRRQNTIEKVIENLKEDEKTLQQMAELNATLHNSHQTLATTLKSMQSEVRERLQEKKNELENLPVESGRIDLVSYAMPSPTQYALLFPSQRIRNSWETDFIKAKANADRQAPPNSKIAPPTSPVPQQANDPPSEFEFVHSMPLQSGRIGIELTCGAIGLPVDTESSQCLWMCFGDYHSGQVSIVDILPSTPSRTLANITVSDSRIRCITAIPSDLCTPVASKSSLPPTISISSFASSNSASSLSSCSDEQPSTSDEQLSILVCKQHDNVPVAFSANEKQSMLHRENRPGDEDTCSTSSMDEQTCPLGSTSKCSLTMENGHSLSPQVVCPKNKLQLNTKRTHMRSNSAPPFPDPPLSVEQPPFSPPEAKLYSPLTLRPAALDWEGIGCNHCMWLGTNDGQVYVYSPGNNLRSRSNRHCVQLEASVSCIRYHDGFAYVGLCNGVLAMFDSSNPGSGPVSSIPVADAPVVSCVPLLTGVGVCAGGTLFSLAADKQSVVPLFTLPSGQDIRDAVSMVGGVWVSVRESPTLHLLHIPSGEPLCSVDCTAAVMTILQGYNPIIRQHKSSSLQVTSLLATSTHLAAGTSAGVVVTFPLPVMHHSFEPHTPIHQPSPIGLPRGHVGPVNFLTSLVRGKTTLLVTGGTGCEDLATMAISQEIPEMCNCLLVWSSNQ